MASAAPTGDRAAAPRRPAPAPTAVARSWSQVGVFSTGVAQIRDIEALLGAQRVLRRPDDARASQLDAVVGWGQKTNTAAARLYAHRHGLPFFRAEDGFLRSVGLGVRGDPPLSIVLDDVGIYYDARRPSRLEVMLNRHGDGDPLADPDLRRRARQLIEQIVSNRLSKYNDSPPRPVDLGRRPSTGRVLVVDQTFGDLSIACGLADERSFARMLVEARAENPRAEILVKTHPDVLAGAKHGYLTATSGIRDSLWSGVDRDRVRVIGEATNPIDLVGQVDHVYTVTSQLGFEALMAGVPVTCFGAPFYAGWGLTRDRVAMPRRVARRSLEEMFAAAYLLYPRYVDPDTGKPCEIERVIDHLALQRREFARNEGAIFCFGFRFWKRGYVRRYLACPGNRVAFASSAEHARRLGFDSRSRLLVWGQRATADVTELADCHGVPIWRMEDGFLRSVGLGSDLTTPASLVVDREGIYYDPTGPSELESILQRGDFSDAELDRARALRAAILDSGLSKYNVGDRSRLVISPGNLPVLLVPGQVEDDASIHLGCRDIRTNLGLLREVRRRNPDAFVLFKPHPDVLSGNRRGQVPTSTALSLADHVECDASLAHCLAVADEVHTMTSLVGFEALLRELRVAVYGQPFYAGWGLTDDRHPVGRRVRQLTLDELVAGTLIRYPRYVSQRTGRFSSPENTVAELVAQRDAGGGGGRLNVSWTRRQLRKLAHIAKGVLDGR